MSSSSAKIKLFWVVAVILLFGGVIYGYQVFDGQRVTASWITQGELRGIAQQAVDRHNTFAGRAEEMLSTIARLPEVRQENWSACNNSLAALLEDEGGRFLNFGVISLDGNVVCSGLPEGGDVYVGDRLYLKRALESGTFSAGEFQVGRITHKKSVNFGYPVRSANGEMQAIAFSALSLEWLDGFSRQTELPPESDFILTDSRGKVLVHTTNDNKLGKPAEESSYAIEQVNYVDEEIGILEANSPEGEPRFLIVAPLKLANQEGFLHLLISVPRDRVQ